MRELRWPADEAAKHWTLRHGPLNIAQTMRKTVLRLREQKHTNAPVSLLCGGDTWSRRLGGESATADRRVGRGGGGGRIRTELADWQPKEGGGGCVGWVSIPIHKAICVLWLLGAWRQVRLLLSWVQRLWEPRGHSQATSMSSKRRHKAFRVHWSRWLRPRLGKQNANRELLSVKSSSVTKKVGAVENKRERSRQETSVTLRQREREAAHGCTDEPNTRKRCHAENKQIPNHL